MVPMTIDFLTFLLFVALAATVGALFLGLGSMLLNNDFNRRHGNRLMRWRVYCQGVALGLFALLLLTRP